MSKKIFCGGISNLVTEQEWKDHFSSFGAASEIRIVPVTIFNCFTCGF